MIGIRKSTIVPVLLVLGTPAFAHAPADPPVLPQLIVPFPFSRGFRTL
jgi:hypothetical protein